jgi:hypothetical protein
MADGQMEALGHHRSFSRSGEELELMFMITFYGYNYGHFINPGLLHASQPKYKLQLLIFKLQLTLRLSHSVVTLLFSFSFFPGWRKHRMSLALTH